MQSPLPVRDGVNATRLRLPDEGPWGTAMDYMMHRWGHIDPQGIEDRFDAGEIVGEGGVPLDRATRLEDHTFIWYYRTLPPETRIPVELTILHQDEHLLVVDKPHFLPTTPGGTYIQESALVRLRNQLNLPDLIPMHRLDRMTAGVLLLSTNPETRGRYQVLFEKRQVQKEYECVSAAEPAAGHPAVDFPVVVRNRMTKVPQLPACRSDRRRAERGEPDRTAGNVRRRRNRWCRGHRRRRHGWCATPGALPVGASFRENTPTAGAHGFTRPGHRERRVLSRPPG